MHHLLFYVCTFIYHFRSQHLHFQVLFKCFKYVYFCFLQCIQVKVNKYDIHVMLCHEFKIGHYIAKATCNIAGAWWVELASRPCVISSKNLLVASHHLTMKNYEQLYLPSRIMPDIVTIRRDLTWIDNVKKMQKWVVLDLNNVQLFEKFNTCCNFLFV